MLALIPFSVDVPDERRPYANWLLIGIISAIFFIVPLDELLDENGKYFHLLSHGWQFPGMFTHMFLHADILHLAGNMLFLWVFGNAICSKIGNRLYIPIFILLGLLANSFEAILGETRPGLGASGAINGIVGMYLFMFPLNDISCLLIVIIRFKVISFSSFWIILYWLAFDLFGLFFDREAGIGYAAHVGGFVSGLLLCLAMTKWWRLKPSNYEMFLPEAIKCRGRMESKDRVLPEYRQLYNEIRYGIKHKTDDDSSETADGEPDAKLAKPDYAARLAAARQEAAFRVKDGHIVFACDCGKKLRVPVKLTGKQSRCPDCQEVIDIPKVKLPAN